MRSLEQSAAQPMKEKKHSEKFIIEIERMRILNSSYYGYCKLSNDKNETQNIEFPSENPPAREKRNIWFYKTENRFFFYFVRCQKDELQSLNTNRRKKEEAKTAELII